MANLSYKPLNPYSKGTLIDPLGDPYRSPKGALKGTQLEGLGFWVWFLP